MPQLSIKPQGSVPLLAFAHSSELRCVTVLLGLPALLLMFQGAIAFCPKTASLQLRIHVCDTFGLLLQAHSSSDPLLFTQWSFLCSLENFCKVGSGLSCCM